MSAPKRIQLRRTKGWRKPEGVVSVVRGTDWGNHYRIGDEIHIPRGSGHTVLTIDRDLAVALFRHWVNGMGWHEQIRRELGGKDLACWCALDAPCHADVLLEIANSATGWTQTEGGKR